MPGPVEVELEALVRQPFALQSVGQPGLAQQIDGALLEQSCADALLDVFATASLNDDGINTSESQQVSEQKAARSRTDDHHLRAQRAHVRWAQAWW